MKPIIDVAKVALSFVSVAAAIAAVGALLGGRFVWCIAFVVAAVAADLVTRCWSRRAPIPMPAYVAWVLFLPRGQSPAKLIRNLQPRPGESILEIGPGVGVHSVPVAAALQPGGVLHVLKHRGRLVIGEVIIDPDFIPLRALRSKIEAAGFVLRNTAGPLLSYMATFDVA